MPLFGSRKQTNCDGCEPNTKVLVDNHALYCCYDPYITSKQNKGGIIKNDFMYLINNLDVGFNKHFLFFVDDQIIFRNINLKKLGRK